VWGFTGTRRQVYPLRVTGRFQRIHRWVGRALLSFLVAVPWIEVGGHPAARIDVPARRVYALGATFTASEGFLLVLFALLAAFALFFFTSLYGRLWCGYACPQTVFLHEFVHPIERWIEGDRGLRMKRDAGPWTPARLTRRAAIWAAFAAVAFAASMAFQSWFAGGPELWTGAAGPADYALVAAFTAVWFADFAWFREQLCNYICPYARFQGALTDDQSQVVAYDLRRGEPRGAKDAKTVGACIDCDKCVNVCPQGIDIREGYQLECINCARCVDACEGVQGKLGHPTLISYATIAEVQGRRTRLLRPRTVAYAGLVSATAAAILFVLATHEAMEAHVQRQPGTLYTIDPDGWIRNTYLVQVASRQSEEVQVQLLVNGITGAQVIVPGVVLAPGESRTVPLVVRVPPSAALPRTIPFHVTFRTADADLVRDATFKTPGAS
jgi:cytochrome c oxidase accessory protein FixG